MSTLKIGYEQARDLLELAVEERGPDFRYTQLNDDGGQGMGCFYFNLDGTPSCIVGWVLNRLGLKLRWDCGTNSSSVLSLLMDDTIDVDTKTLSLLSTAQCCQDSGWTWEHAVAYATWAANKAEEHGLAYEDGSEACFSDELTDIIGELPIERAVDFEAMAAEFAPVEVAPAEVKETV